MPERIATEDLIAQAREMAENYRKADYHVDATVITALADRLAEYAAVAELLENYVDVRPCEHGGYEATGFPPGGGRVLSANGDTVRAALAALNAALEKRP